MGVAMLLQSGPRDIGQWVALSAGILAVAYLLLRKGSRRKDPLDHKPPLTLAQHRQVDRDMGNLLVELSDMARQVSSQLDTRAKKLELLIDEADRRIERLTGIMATGAPVSPTDRPAPREPSPNRDFPPIRDLPNARDYPPARDLQTHRDFPPTPTAPPDGLDPRHADIHRLADEGLGARAIAEKLNRPNGEVELILALRHRA